MNREAKGLRVQLFEMRRNMDLTNEQWEVLEPLIPEPVRRADVICSPKTDPATMRVPRPEMVKRRTLEVEEETHPRADRPHAARSGRRAGRRSLGSPDRKEARHQRGDLPSLEEPIRRDEG